MIAVSWLPWWLIVVIVAIPLEVAIGIFVGRYIFAGRHYGSIGRRRR